MQTLTGYWLGRLPASGLEMYDLKVTCIRKTLCQHAHAAACTTCNTAVLHIQHTMYMTECKIQSMDDGIALACMTLLSSHSCQIELGYCCCGVHASGGHIGQASIRRHKAAVGLQKIWVGWPDTALSVVRGTSHLLRSGLNPCVSCSHMRCPATLCPTPTSVIFPATHIAGQQHRDMG